MLSTVLLILGFLLGLTLTWSLTLAETALGYISYRQAQDVVQDHPKNPLLDVLDELPEHLISIQFWRVFAQAAAAVCGTLLIVGFTDQLWLTVLIALLLMAVVTGLLLVISPRAIATQNEVPAARFTSGLVRNLRRVLGPFPKAFVTDFYPDDTDDDDDDDLEERHFREYVSRANKADVLEDNEAEVIQSVFDMDDTIVRAVMVPRTDVVWLETGTGLSDAVDIFINSGNSRIPLIGDNPDDVLGMVYLKDVVRALHTKKFGPYDPTDFVVRQVRFVPESKTVWDLLTELQQEATQIAIVVDEYGGTAGLVTLEDLIEELVGEIADEYDQEEFEDVVQMGDNEYLVNAKMSVSDFADTFELSMDDDEDVDTVGGLFAKYFGKMPIMGSQTTIEDLQLRVESLQGRRNRVHTIRVWRTSPDDLSTDIQESA